MLHDLRQHSTHYAILGGFLAVMLTFFMLVYGNEVAEILTILLTGIGYWSWGIFHHFKNHDLDASIVAEYTFVAIMAITILVVALFNR